MRMETALDDVVSGHQLSRMDKLLHERTDEKGVSARISLRRTQRALSIKKGRQRKSEATLRNISVITPKTTRTHSRREAYNPLYRDADAMLYS